MRSTPGFPRTARRIVVGLAAAAVGLSGAPALAGVPADAPAAGLVEVVVQSTGDRADAVAAVRSAGGTVLVDLPIVDGVTARVPATAVDRVAASPGVLAVTADEPVTTAETSSTTASTVKQAFVQATGADKMHSRGVLGQHVAGVRNRVALIDTGVDTEQATSGDLAGRVVPVRDWRTPDGPLVPCVDFSGESSCDDTYGHGTFMAGLIAGDGRASGGQFSGAAPGAEIVSVKIAGRTGAADVTKVLAAVQWVVSFAKTYDIGVLNLSLGSNSRTSTRTDPLNRAVQRAWDAGIVVVVAAGNTGVPQPGEPWTVHKPGDDPLVLTVGATDDRESPGTSDDRVPRFSSRGGPGLAKPDLAVSGAHLVSLRAVGSTLDGVGTKLDGTYRRGSGTSMAAAVTSGTVALLRQAQPTWTPDEVKAAYLASARKVGLSDAFAVGRGTPDVFEAARKAVAGATQPRNAPEQLTSLDESRAGLVVSREVCRTVLVLQPPFSEERCSPEDLRGQTTAQDLAFDGNDWTGNDWTEATWYASQWTGNDWTGNDWTGNDWTGNDWTGNDWTGADWDGGSDETESYGGESADPAQDSLVRGSLLYGSTR